MRPQSPAAWAQEAATDAAIASDEIVAARTAGILCERSSMSFSPLAYALLRVATWNVNSVKQRVPRLLPWLDERKPDVVCLQETKLADGAFDALLGEELAGRGYEGARHGEVQG